jgi:hypothetical protein
MTAEQYMEILEGLFDRVQNEERDKPKPVAEDRKE